MKIKQLSEKIAAFFVVFWLFFGTKVVYFLSRDATYIQFQRLNIATTSEMHKVYFNVFCCEYKLYSRFTANIMKVLSFYTLSGIIIFFAPGFIPEEV